MKRRLEDSIVVITGASAGIGRALAQELWRHRCKLVLAARRVDRLEQLNRELGGVHHVVACDVADPRQCDALIRSAADRFGRIDTLVCNAGYGMLEPVAQMSDEAMRRIFQTNVFGTSDCIHAAVPVLRRQEVRDGWRGQIVIVSSAAARRGLPYFGAYAATKAAQMSLAESLRVELHEDRIAVTSVHPMGTGTEFFVAAETGSRWKMPDRDRLGRQSVGVVARKMVRAMERPRAEVWPAAFSRLTLLVAMAFPRLGDWVMRREWRAIARHNRPGP